MLDEGAMGRMEEVRRRVEERGKWVETMGLEEMEYLVMENMSTLSYDDVVRCKKVLGKVWTGTTEQKRMYGALKDKERELIASGEAMESEVYGMRAYLRKRQMEDAQRRPGRSVSVWGRGGSTDVRPSGWRA